MMESVNWKTIEAIEITEDILKARILAAYAYLAERGDKMHAEKIKQLAIKLRDGEFSIAFCGHFSAGKSTMINQLIGEKLLPSSPIPTSANLVKVKKGQAYAKVYFKNGSPRVYLAPYDYEMVKRFCKDGDQIQSIEISHALSKLPPQVAVLDTPGIDSADDAHRVATESAIHLADLVFYVMDYNHVQSELNFMFTKELMENGKEVYLVVNQVDKHNEQELSFTAFKESVEGAFASWGVTPAEIFYTSLKDNMNTRNELAQLQSFLAQRLAKKDRLLMQSVACSLQKILNDHLKNAFQSLKEQLRPARELLDTISAEELEEIATTYEGLLKEAQVLSENDETAGRIFDREIDKLMGNAYLTPFSTRALAESYLEACQANFKVGWLFSKDKTAAEKAVRRDAFYADLCEKVKSELSWHLRDFLMQFSQPEDTVLRAKLRDFSISFSHKILDAAIKDGAKMSGEYVLNYTASVANEIKRLAKMELVSLKKEILQEMRLRLDTTKARLHARAADLEKYMDALRKIKHFKEIQRAAQDEVKALLDEAETTEGFFDFFAVDDENIEVIRGEAVPDTPQKEKKIMELKEKEARNEKSTDEVSPDKIKQTAANLKHAAIAISKLPGFSKLADELAEKAERLAHKGFTVALFGAFSAGKSSFANALIGERVLPVSPNPTTAAINRIRPIDEDNGHGAVRVKLKDEQAMLDDINRALGIFSLHASSLDEALSEVGRLEKSSQSDLSVKTHYAFLLAFANGYNTFRGQLGTVCETVLDHFGDYVACEGKSCFVEWIDLYYDCPLTRRGITLVDTPGADSINARHTGVAFEFIKNADAILFVTYYNHAFSKADREFLIQLGRVKDAFQLDKMFFIINAIDLAEDEQEKELVTSYVHEHLVKYGVRNPDLYSLSSLQALRDKTATISSSASGMELFEEHFYHFITYDLANLASKASEIELSRVCRIVEQLISNAEQDADLKQQKCARIETEKDEIMATIENQTAQELQERLHKETEELIFYIKQRVFLRFNDFFREAFNPNVLRDDGRDLNKALFSALKELIEDFGFVFAEEMRATTVRLDRFMEKAANEFQLKIIQNLNSINMDLSFSQYEGYEGGNTVRIEFESAFTEMPNTLFSKPLAYFKNTKSFFEKGESKRMREEIRQILYVEADHYLAREQSRLQLAYENLTTAQVDELIAHMTQQAEDFYFSLLAALDGGIPVSKLYEVRQSLQRIQ